MTRYRVAAPMVNVTSPSSVLTPPAGYRGPAIVPVAAFYADALLPDDVPADEIARLLDAGLIVAED